MNISRNTIVVLMLVGLTSACAVAPTVTKTMEVPDSADVPYKNVLVLVLFSRFDTRRYLEDEIVANLQTHGVKAVASTSMMTSQTRLTRDFILETMTELGSDSLLLTQLADLETTGKVIDMSPEATTIFRPTYYYNVFTVETTEYIEPQDVAITHELSTASDLYSMSNREMVWGITTYSKIKENVDHMRDYSIYVDEANAIASAMVSEGVVSR